jgi:hypothetical protein
MQKAVYPEGLTTSRESVGIGRGIIADSSGVATLIARWYVAPLPTEMEISIINSRCQFDGLSIDQAEVKKLN